MMLKIIVVLLILMIFSFTTSTVYADIAITCNPTDAYNQYQIKAILIATLFTAIFNYGFNFLITSIIFYILGLKIYLFKKKYFLYVLLMTGGGYLIDLIIVALFNILPFPLKPLSYSNTLIRFGITGICAIILLFTFNIFLANKMYQLDKKHSLIIGIVIAIFTNPVFSLIIGTFMMETYEKIFPFTGAKFKEDTFFCIYK